MRILVFVLVIGGVVSLIHWYFWARLVKATTGAGRGRRIGAAVIVVLAILPVLAMALRDAHGAPAWLRDVVAWSGFLWLGTMFYLLVALLISEPLRLVLRGWVKADPAATVGDSVTKARPATAKLVAESTAGEASEPLAATTTVAVEADSEPADLVPSEKPVGPSRRQILSRGIAVGAGLAAAGTMGYGMVKAFGKPAIEHIPITLDKLDPALDGYRIGVVSDIHLGPFVRRPRVQTIVNMLNRLDVGAVTIVGDLVDGDVEDLGSYAEPLGELSAPDGSYFVTGNHEYYSGAEQWIEFLPTLGVRVLQNERLTIERGNAGFELAGVNDLASEETKNPGPDLKKALAGRDANKPVVLLAHQPVFFDEAVNHGVDLQLSGHTHGGQMWPFHYLVRMDQPLVAGWERRRNSQLYVTRGVGFWGPPVRVGAPPEITVIELRARRD